MRDFKRRFILIVIVILSICVACNHPRVSDRKIIPDPQTSIPSPENNSDNLYIPPRKDVRILVISDLNSQYGSTEYEPEIDKVIALIPQWQPDLILCGGDMVAGQKKTLTEAQIKAMWAAFDRHIAAPLREYKIPFGFTIGNHDGSGAIVNKKLIFANERELASAYWNDSKHDPGLNFLDKAQFPFYYSFADDALFFLVWDASTQHISPQQLAWVEQTLASEAAQQATMKIALGHLPLYPITEAKNKPGEYLAEAEKLRSLLAKNQVHTYISGHQHAYYPGKKGQLELLHAGALGQGARQLINSDVPPRHTITLVDIELASTTTTYTTYDIKTLQTIELKTLPRFIEVNRARILRRDIQLQDLAN